LDPSRAQRLAGHDRVCEKAFVFRGMAARGLVQTAFEIAKDDLGGTELVPDDDKGHRGVGDVHQVHVTSEDHLHRYFSTVRRPILSPAKRRGDHQ